MQRKLHHITRLDYVYGTRETHGWWVRIQRLVKGRRKTFGATFYDKKYGGKQKALEAAIAWRDENLPRHPVIRNGQGSGRRHAPIGHAIFWEYKSGKKHTFNANMKTSASGRALQFRCSITEYGRTAAAAIVREWYREQRQILRKKGTLASDATLKAYWNAQKKSRGTARQVPW